MPGNKGTRRTAWGLLKKPGVGYKALAHHAQEQRVATYYKNIFSTRADNAHRDTAIGVVLPPTQIFATERAAEARFQTVLRNNAHLSEMIGMTGAGKVARDARAALGYHPTPKCCIKPYYFQGVTLRGGPTYAAKTENGMAAIPIAVSDRALTSIQCRYTNPRKFPSTRIIKISVGHWGGLHTEPAERLYLNPGDGSTIV